MLNQDKKILQITMHYIPIIGGQEVYIKNLNIILEKNGYNVSVLQRKTKKIFKQNNIITTPNISRFIFGHPIIKGAEWFSFNAGLYLKRNIISKYDTIISHYPFHYPPIKNNNKIIIVSHGTLWGKRKTIFDIYHKKISLKIKNKKNVFIVANDTHFIRELGYKVKPNEGRFSEIKKNIWFIPNCIDINVFKRNPEIKKENIILVPRNIRPDRGIDLAIKAFNEFNKKNKKFKMLIVGKGGGKYMNYCKNIIKEYNLTEKVAFIKHASQHEMINYYNSSLITLIPTIEKEGTSLSALESMSCGTATITTSVAGLLDIPGFKADPNEKSLSEALDFVIKNEEIISKKQETEVRNNFNLDLWEKSWINVINTINK